MAGNWSYNESSNVRRRAVKKVDELIQSIDSESGRQEFEINYAESFNDEASVWFEEEFQGSRDSENEQIPKDRFLSDEEEMDHSDACSNTIDDLKDSLADWATEFSIPLIALSALLCILQVHHPSLPKDGRTLLKTKTAYKIETLSGGMFHYFGILSSFQGLLNKMWSVVPDRHAFKLQLNFDGLPLFKSSSTQFWPILGMLQGYSEKPVLIGLFCGNTKPKSLSEYLQHLVSELKSLSSGFVFQGKRFFLNLCSVVCDTPARAFVKGVKSHCAYHGCDKCHQIGVRIGHRMTFPDLSARRRTDECFRQNTDVEHHHEHSPLADLNIDMIASFPYDYMHLVCLGVMRRLLDLWMGPPGPLRCRMSSSQASLISERLLSLRDYIPSEFTRRPRTLAEKNRWKASEFRQFLLYTGPVVMKDVLKSQIYDNFMLLSIGVHILLSSEYCLKMNNLANSLLVSFVEHFGQLYGQEFLVYNFHGLAHLCEDVKIHGNLDLFSSFPYENFLGHLKKLVRGPRNPLTQVIRRLSEIDEASSNCNLNAQASNDYKSEHTEGPVPQFFTGEAKQFKVLSMDGAVIKTTNRDSCIKIKNKFVLVENIIVDRGVEYFVGRDYRCKESFFEYPFDSTELDIFVVSNLSLTVKHFQRVESVQKYVRLPFHDKFVVIPLLHLNKPHGSY